MTEFNVLGFAGSLRKDSYNRKLLAAAAKIAPDGMSITTFDLEDLPFFNADVEKVGDPAPVVEFKAAIAAADAILIATPEYQHGIPGVLKNALDWASRPGGKSALQEKPVATVGASPGMTGTARAQIQLRQTLAYNRCFIALPEVLVGQANKKFDDDGNLTDEAAKKFLIQLLENLQDLAKRIKRS